jgi:hypothetical protein
MKTFMASPLVGAAGGSNSSHPLVDEDFDGGPIGGATTEPIAATIQLQGIDGGLPEGSTGGSGSSHH